MLKLKHFFNLVFHNFIYAVKIFKGDIHMTMYSKLNLFGLILLAGGYVLGAAAPPVTCSFNGQVIANDGRLVAYQNSTVPEGESCVSEVRQCVDGVLYGSFAYASCTVSQNASCLFSGQTVAHGGSVTAYTSSSVPFGQSCSSMAEVRTCNNGILSGSAAYSSCEANTPRACLFNGETLSHGESVKAFQASTSQFGGSCTSETRTCNDGTLSGSYAFGVCNIDQPASCLFDGRTIAHGENVAAFLASSVVFGQTCIAENRSCYNGQLSGSNHFSSCSIDQPASCSFDGRTIISGESVTAFSSLSVPFGGSCQSEARSCLNGQLSGSFNSSSCSVESAISCSFNGQSIAHDGSVIAYSSASVPFGGTCQSEVRTCSNGQLSGSFNKPACAVTPAADCAVNGLPVKHDSSTTLYVSSSVPYGQTCQAQQRACNNGQLSGTAIHATCVVENAPPAKSCSLNGKTIASGSAIIAFQSSTVAFGKNCVSQSRACNDGVLSGSYTSESCSVQTATTCSFNGQAVAHGASVIAYNRATGTSSSAANANKRSCGNNNNQPCKSEQRTCHNGQLSGSYNFATCTGPQPKSCTLNGKTIASGSSVTVFAQSSVPYGQSCKSEQRLCTDGKLSGSATQESCIVEPKPPVQLCDMSKIIWEFSTQVSNGCGRMIFGSLESRVSRDGGKTWVYVNHRNLPEDLKEIFKYITKKQRLEGTTRPKNFMVDSKNKGYVTIRVELLPGCDVCKFVETTSNGHSCSRRKASKKVVKFICEDVRK
jgi:hypothetical protein